MHEFDVVALSLKNYSPKQFPHIYHAHVQRWPLRPQASDLRDLGAHEQFGCSYKAYDSSHSRYIYLSLLANSPTDLMHQAGELPVMGNFPRQTDCKAGGE